MSSMVESSASDSASRLEGPSRTSNTHSDRDFWLRRTSHAHSDRSFWRRLTSYGHSDRSLWLRRTARSVPVEVRLDRRRPGVTGSAERFQALQSPTIRCSGARWRFMELASSPRNAVSSVLLRISSAWQLLGYRILRLSIVGPCLGTRNSLVMWFEVCIALATHHVNGACLLRIDTRGLCHDHQD